MKILSVNAGSSSLKFQMYEMPEEKVLISGVFERIGIENSFYTIKLNGEKINYSVTKSTKEGYTDQMTITTLYSDSFDLQYTIYFNKTLVEIDDDEWFMVEKSMLVVFF